MHPIEIMIMTSILYLIFSIPLVCFYLEREQKKRLKSGEKLIHWMTCWSVNKGPSSFLKVGNEDEKGYKFYTRLINEILFFQRELGGYPKRNFQVMKKALLGDLRFEKKVEKEMRGSLFQYICLGLITWLFIGGSHKILGSKVSLSLETLPKVLCFQLLGVLFYQVFCRRIKRKDFYFFNLYYEPLFRFFSLIYLNLPVGMVLEKSGLEVFYRREPETWKPILEDLRSLINKWKN